MLRIDRAVVPIPGCLAASPAGRRYSRLTAAEREEIRTRLLDIQKHRCAYCERRTAEDRDDGHIEHFHSQANNQELSLTWSNLFWSCNDEKTCGKHKDKCTKTSGHLAKFDPCDLVNPGNDDPSEYFLFVVDGSVRPREDLDPRRRRRAEETLRVFQIADSPYLRRSREDAVNPYLGAIELLYSDGQEAVIRYVRSQMNRVSESPFATAIRQYLEGFLP